MAPLLVFVLAAAQTTPVEVEPLTCWWRTSAAAVRVGEPFTVVLTCSLLQTEAARVIADESRLEPSVVQLPPFEVIGGARARDLATAGRRFVQFEYRLRAIAENVFASEIRLPPLEITYRVESRAPGGDSLEGRDLTYALPPLTMRLVSLVPDTASDIREAPIATLADVETVSSRATMFRVAAGVGFTLGVLLLALAISRMVRRRTGAKPATTPALPAAAILHAVRRDLTAIQEEVRASGWTSDLVGRALAGARVVAAYATRRPVTQRLIGDGSRQSGEVIVSGRSGRAAVSAAIATVEDAELDDTLSRLAAIQYGREPLRDGSDARLDQALEVAVARADQLIAERPWTERLWTR